MEEKYESKQPEKPPTSVDKGKEFTLYRQRWVVLAIFSLLSMTNEVIWISLSSITSIVKEYYEVSYIAVNWLSMIYMLFYIFVAVAAYALAKNGLKFTIVIGATLNGIGSCLRLIGSSRSGFVYAFLGNASAAFAQCFILFVPPTLAATWFGDKERATASAIGVLMNMLGVAVGFLMGGMMVPSSEDYDGVVKAGIIKTLLIQAVFCTALVVFCVILVRDAPPTPPTRSQFLILQSKQQKFNQKIKKMKDKKSNVEQTNFIDNDKGLNQEATREEPESPLQKSAPSVELIGFKKALKILAKDKSFHLVTQAYGFYFGLFAAYNTVLNQMCTVYFPGKEKEIGLMGFTSVLLGLVGILLAGIWLDKTTRYKFISIGTFICCAVSLLVFTLILAYSKNFTLVFLSFCVFGFFSYPYMTVGLEHAAEVTYPISEGITSGILLLVGNMYGIVMTFIFGAIIDRGKADIAGYIMAICYGFGLVAVVVMKGELKRLQADREKINQDLKTGR